MQIQWLRKLEDKSCMVMALRVCSLMFWLSSFDREKSRASHPYINLPKKSKKGYESGIGKKKLKDPLS